MAISKPLQETYPNGRIAMSQPLHENIQTARSRYPNDYTKKIKTIKIEISEQYPNLLCDQRRGPYFFQHELCRVDWPALIFTLLCSKPEYGLDTPQWLLWNVLMYPLVSTKNETHLYFHLFLVRLMRPHNILILER